MSETLKPAQINRGYLAALAATGFNTFTPIFIRVLTENDELSGEDVVAGFRCRVGRVFL